MRKLTLSSYSDDDLYAIHTCNVALRRLPFQVDDEDEEDGEEEEKA